MAQESNRAVSVGHEDDSVCYRILVSFHMRIFLALLRRHTYRHVRMTVIVEALPMWLGS